MCGPSNAAKGLTRFMQQDWSLQRDRLTAPSGAQDVTQSFRDLRLDQNTEFSRFQHQNTALPALLPAPLPAPLRQHPRNESLYPKIDLLETDPQVWAGQFSRWRPNDPTQRPVAPIYNPRPSPIATTAVPAVAPATYNNEARLSHFPTYAAHQVPQAHQAGSYLGPSHTPFRNNVASTLSFQDSRTHLPDNSNVDVDFDFDNELRAWCTANSPEAEVQVNEFLGDEAILKGEITMDNRLMAAINAQRLADVTEILIEQKLTSQTKESLRAQRQADAEALDDSELAMAAQQILDSVSDNDSAKFRESSFMQLMRRIASKDLVVRHNDLVDTPRASAADAGPDKIVPRHATVEDAASPLNTEGN